MATHGRRARTPKNFATQIRVCGHTIYIRYYLSIRAGKTQLDGWLNANTQEIWVATFKRTPQAISDAIWHEAKHYMLYTCRNNHDKYNILTEQQEELLISHFELTDGLLMRDNEWFWRLYGPGA